jgi:hypothetical protein
MQKPEEVNIIVDRAKIVSLFTALHVRLQETQRDGTELLSLL